MRLTGTGTLAAALFAAILGLSGAAAQEGRNPLIEETIRNQFDAFRAEDYLRAFTYASPTIKGMFGTAERFGMMVQNGYPMVARPGTVRMLDLRTVAGRLWQRVMVTDEAGKVHLLDYQMIETVDGWQINAVQLLPETGVGA